MQKSSLEMISDLSGRANSRSDVDRLLAIMRDTYGFSDVAYVAMNIPSAEGPGFHFQNTYSAAWRRHYHTNRFILIDPVVRRCMSGILPQDWKILRERHGEGRRVFDEANDFGLPQQGVSIPVRGMHGEVAVVSLTSHAKRTEWDKFLKRTMRDLQTMAGCVHHAVILQKGCAVQDIALTTSERDCLSWSAEGKSAWETSRILGISESTVRFHLCNARSKLGCVNTTQAAVKAMLLRLIG